MSGAARWIAEALETGNPLAPLPAEIAPADVAAGTDAALEALESLGLVPCGIRMAPGPDGSLLAGPMLEARLLPEGAAIGLGALRHPKASAALVAVLAAPLDPGEDTPPALATVHPALDLAAHRFREAPADAAGFAADLAGLGLVVAGRRRSPPTGPLAVALGEAERRPRGRPVDLAPRLAAAARAARALGGLPAGALLVLAGLSDPRVPVPGQRLAARLGPLGSASASFA